MRNGLAQFNDLVYAKVFSRLERLKKILFLRSRIVIYPVESMAMTGGIPWMKSRFVSISIAAALMSKNAVKMMVMRDNIMSQVSH